LETYSGADFFERLLRDRPGNVVIISGNNQDKMKRIEALARAGFNILADKPWLIEAADLPRLRAALDAAQRNGVVACDAMTQHFEITAIVQRSLVSDPAVFGTPLAGSPDDPAVRLESLHFLFKTVGGQPNLRPPWFFDIRQQGEGLADVGTHLADIVPWVLFPDQALAQNDIELLDAQRWPTALTLLQFKAVTGEKEFPLCVRDALVANELSYYCNNSVNYRLRGRHVKLVVRWGYEAAPGAGDSELAIFRGSKARVEVRQEREQNFRREVFVLPASPVQSDAVLAAVRKRLQSMEPRAHGLAARLEAGRIRIEIPESLRLGHEEHFALLARGFLELVHSPKTLPVWENPNLLAKYYVTTKGVELARKNQASGAITPNHPNPNTPKAN
jgi:predicted dehydrogenase